VNHISKLSQKETELMFIYLKKHFNDNQIKTIIQNYPLTGTNGIRKMLAEIDLEYFAKTYFPKYFSKDFCEFHTTVMQELDWLIKNKSKRMVVGVPRGYGKSTLSSFLFPIYILLYKKLNFILLVSATEDTAIPFLNMIKDEISSNDLIIEDFGQLKKPNLKWSSTEIHLSNDTALAVRGIDGSIRGIRYKEHRAQLIIGDDLIKDDVAESASAREKLANTYKDSLLNAGDENSRVLVVGTVLHNEDILSELLSPETTGYKQLFFQSVLNFSESEKWAQWRKLYTSLEDKDREQTAYQYFINNQDEMLKNTKVLWEEKFDYYHLMKKLIDDGESSFYKEMMCQPRGADEYVFQNIEYFKQLPDLKDCQVVMSVDVAMGKKKGDFSAVTILAKNKQTNYKYVVDGDIQRIKPDKLIDLIIKKLKNYDGLVDALVFEAVAFQEYLLDNLKKRLKKEDIYIRVIPLKPKGKKETRIMQLQPDIANGTIKFNQDNMKYNAQVKDWNARAKNDDAVDSLQMAWEQINKLTKRKQVRPKPSWL